MSARNKTCLRSIYLFPVLLVLLSAYAGSEIYKWTDKDGTIHFSDNPHDIPNEYRPKIEKKSYDDSAVPIPSDKGIAGDEGSMGEKPALKEVRVPYVAYEGSASRIIIPITFDGKMTVPMLLDTGAPGMFISKELARRIGLLDMDNGKLDSRTSGIGGKQIPSILTIVEKVSVGEATTLFLPTTIVDNVLSTKAFDGLVGMDFMANYDLQIDSINQIVIFKELPPQPNRPGGRNEHWWRSKFQVFHDLKIRWEKYARELDDLSPRTTEIESLSKDAHKQAVESAKLYDRLERFATQNGVPRTWRK